MLLLFIINKSYSQLKPYSEIEFGYKNINAKLGQDNKWYAANLRRYFCYSNLILGIKNDKFEIGTNIENYFGYDDGASFTPKQVSYTFFTTYKIKKITFTYEHFCSHPIIPKVTDLYLKNDSYFTNSYDKITVKYKIL